MAATARSKTAANSTPSTTAVQGPVRVSKQTKPKKKIAPKKSLKQDHRPSTPPPDDLNEPQTPQTPEDLQTADNYEKRMMAAWGGEEAVHPAVDILLQYAPRPDEKDPITGRATFATFDRPDPGPTPFKDWSGPLQRATTHYMELTRDCVQEGVQELSEFGDKKFRIGVDPNAKFCQLMLSDVKAVSKIMRDKLKACKEEVEAKQRAPLEAKKIEIMSRLGDYEAGRVSEKDIIRFLAIELISQDEEIQALKESNMVLREDVKVLQRRAKYDTDPSFKHVLREQNKLKQVVYNGRN